MFLNKLKTELPYDPAIPLLGIYPEKTLIQKDTGGMYLVVQRVRLHACNAGGAGSIPGWGTKIPHAVWPPKKTKLHACGDGYTTL